MDERLEYVGGHIVDAGMKIHMALGPGLLESVYEVLMERELARRGFRVERQKPIDFMFDGVPFEKGFYVDLMVEESVIVELKSVEKLIPVHAKQLITYLRLTEKKLGFVMNFGGATLKEGLHRLVNNRA